MQGKAYAKVVYKDEKPEALIYAGHTESAAQGKIWELLQEDKTIDYCEVVMRYDVLSTVGR